MKYVKRENYYGLEYVTVYLKVSRTHPKYGDLIQADTIGAAAKSVSSEIVNRKIPLRGVEIKFIRKALGLSLRDMGAALGISHVAVDKWERAKKKRLDPINEVAVRSLFAQLMKVEISGWFDSLKGTEKAPKKLEIRAA